jgi:hypothetical protein
VLESAIANAEHNDGADIDALKVKTIHVRRGYDAEALHRACKGSWQSHLKQTCHILRDGWRVRRNHGTEDSSDRVPPRGHAQLVSRWYANSKDFAGMLNEDLKVRELSEEEARARFGGPRGDRAPAKNARITDVLGASGCGDRQEGRRHRIAQGRAAA